MGCPTHGYDSVPMASLPRQVPAKRVRDAVLGSGPKLSALLGERDLVLESPLRCLRTPQQVGAEEVGLIV